MNYEFSRDAEADLRRLYRFGLLQFGERLADSYLSGIEDECAKIAADPLMFPAVYHLRENCRRCVYRPHSIYYKIEDSGIFILRILGAQNPQTAFE